MTHFCLQDCPGCAGRVPHIPLLIACCCRWCCLPLTAGGRAGRAHEGEADGEGPGGEGLAEEAFGMDVEGLTHAAGLHHGAVRWGRGRRGRGRGRRGGGGAPVFVTRSTWVRICRQPQQEPQTLFGSWLRALPHPMGALVRANRHLLVVHSLLDIGTACVCSRDVYTGFVCKALPNSHTVDTGLPDRPLGNPYNALHCRSRLLHCGPVALAAARLHPRCVGSCRRRTTGRWRAGRPAARRPPPPGARARRLGWAPGRGATRAAWRGATRTWRCVGGRPGVWAPQ